MSKIKLPLPQAEKLALKVVNALAPGCERIEIAGSVRRKKPMVGDIEIVAIPKMISIDLFGEVKVSSLDDVLRSLVNAGRLVQGDKDGDKLKTFYIPAVEGLKLDLFITTPEQWGVIFTIRTGSAEFSKQLVTQKYKGGLLPDDLHIAGGRVWRGNEALSTPEEVDVFKVTGVEWVEPEERV